MIGQALPELYSRSRGDARRFLRQVHPGYTFKLQLPPGCRRSGVFRSFVPIVTGRRWRAR